MADAQSLLLMFYLLLTSFLPKYYDNSDDITQSMMISLRVSYIFSFHLKSLLETHFFSSLFRHFSFFPLQLIKKIAHHIRSELLKHIIQYVLSNGSFE